MHAALSKPEREGVEWGGGGGDRPNRYGELNPQPGACKLVKLNFDRL